MLKGVSADLSMRSVLRPFSSKRVVTIIRKEEMGSPQGILPQMIRSLTFTIKYGMRYELPQERSVCIPM